jgi:hypothetical protein
MLLLITSLLAIISVKVKISPKLLTLDLKGSSVTPDIGAKNTGLSINTSPIEVIKVFQKLIYVLLFVAQKTHMSKIIFIADISYCFL